MYPDPIRIFVGTPPNNEDLECQAVLDWSVRKHLAPGREVAITWMMLSRDPRSYWYADPPTKGGWNTATWATPFSPLRWGIPEFCGFEGRAIYMDSDQFCMTSISELWDQDIPAGKALLMSEDHASCVMLFDCARMRGVYDYEKLKKETGFYRHVRGTVASASAPFVGNWNCRDGRGCNSIHEPHVKIVHYTAIPTQPNHHHARERLKSEGREHWFPGPDVRHGRQDIIDEWEKLFAEAKAAGRGPEFYRQPNEYGDWRKRAQAA